MVTLVVLLELLDLNCSVCELTFKEVKPLFGRLRVSQYDHEAPVWLEEGEPALSRLGRHSHTAVDYRRIMSHRDRA